MKSFKKAALAAAVAALPMTGFAMEALQDEALSEVTGQDGITITMGPVGAFDIFIGDDDGLTGTQTLGLGGMYIEGFNTGTGNVTIDLDSDADTIQAGITIGAGTWTLGSISATTSAAAGAGTEVLNLGTLNMSGVTVNVQLGNEDQGHFAAISGTITGGVFLNEFTINDLDGTGAADAGAIVLDVGVTSNGSADLNLGGTYMDVSNGGLVIGGLTPIDITLGDVRLGGAAVPDIGDITILNLTPPTLTISGH